LLDYENLFKKNILQKTGFFIQYDKLRGDMKRSLAFKHSVYFILGAEESCGYLGHDGVRDKDAHSAAIMACEAFCWLRRQGLTVFDYLNSIYRRHGYHNNQLYSINCQGAGGMESLTKCLKSFASNPITSLADRKVIGTMDFSKDDIYDAEGKMISKQAFWIFDLEGGCRVAIRASGTEPKMKCYLFYKGEKKNFRQAATLSNIIFKELIAAIQQEIKRRTQMI
jgi:phosphoglucomutase